MRELILAGDAVYQYTDEDKAMLKKLVPDDREGWYLVFSTDQLILQHLNT